MSESKAETWIKAGYILLGLDGLEGIKIERIARHLRLNKSGYYYYFGDMGSYVKKLLEYHSQIATEIAAEISSCGTVDPDLLLLIVKHRSFFLVESQLLIKSRSLLSSVNIDIGTKVMDKELFSLWKRTSALPDDSAVAQSFLNIVRHFFYARIDPENLSYEFLHSLATETKVILSRANC